MFKVTSKHKLYCGRGGIRTPGTLITYNGFQDHHHKPLGHSSKFNYYKHRPQVTLMTMTDDCCFQLLYKVLYIVVIKMSKNVKKHNFPC